MNRCPVTEDLNRYLDQQDKLAAKQEAVDSLKADILAEGVTADDVYEALQDLSEGGIQHTNALEDIAKAVNAGDLTKIGTIMRKWAIVSAEKRAESEAEEQLKGE